MIYNIQFGCSPFAVEYEVAGANNAQDALDMLVDYLELEGAKWCFIDGEDAWENGGEYAPDVYTIAGNHGLYFYHGGNLFIKETDDDTEEYGVREVE